MEPASPRSPTALSTSRYAAPITVPLTKSPRAKRPPPSLAAVVGLPPPSPSIPHPQPNELVTTLLNSATVLPPLVPSGPASPRNTRDAGFTLRPLAFPLQLDRDYPVAQLDAWPLTTTNSLSWNGAPSPHSEPSSSSPQANSPLPPRMRKAHARHKLFDETRSRPLLLQELYAFLRAELHAISQADTCQGSSPELDDHDDDGVARKPPNLQRLQVFRELFCRVIESFSVYAPLLAQIKDEYESTIALLQARCQLLPQLHGELQSLEAQCLQELSKHQMETKLRYKTLKQALKATQAKLTACAAQNAHLTDENRRLQDQLQRLEQRSEEMQLSNHTLVNGMKRHDDTLRHIHERSREEGMALQQMALKYHRACDEIAELKKTVASLEEKVGGVHVAADKAMITLLTRELQEMHSKLMAKSPIVVSGSSDTDGDSSPEHALLQLLFKVLETNGVAGRQTEVLEMVRMNSLGRGSASPTNRRAVAHAPLTRTSSVVSVSSVSSSTSLAVSPSRLALPSMASTVSKHHHYTPPPNPLVGICAEDLALGIDRVASILSEQIAVYHQQIQQLLHRSSQREPAASGTTFLTEPEELASFSTANGRVLTPLLSTNDFIQTQGMDTDVPEYLQYEGVVRNLYFDRKRVELLISKIWLHKDDLDGKAKRQSASGATAAAGISSSPSSVSLEQALSLYLQRCFPSSRHEQVECAYNLVASLERFAAASSDCRLFLLTLQGQLPTEARSDQTKELFALHDALFAIHREFKTHTPQRNNGDTGLPLADVVQALRRHFPWKSDAQQSCLHRALLLDQRGHSLVDYVSLLLQHDDNAGPHRNRNMLKPRAKSRFAESLRAQYIDDLLGFRQHLERHVQLAMGSSTEMPSAGEHVGPTGGGGMLSIRALRECLQRSDPAKPVQDINRLLSVAIGLSMDQILTHDAMMVSAPQFAARLPTVLVKPSGKFDDDAVAVDTTHPQTTASGD